MLIKQRFSKCNLNFDISGVLLFIQLLEPHQWCNGQGARLEWCNGQGARLECGNGQGARLEWCNGQDARLEWCNGQGARLEWCNGQGARLECGRSWAQAPIGSKQRLNN